MSASYILYLIQEVLLYMCCIIHICKSGIARQQMCFLAAAGVQDPMCERQPPSLMELAVRCATARATRRPRARLFWQVQVPISCI